MRELQGLIGILKQPIPLTIKSLENQAGRKNEEESKKKKWMKKNMDKGK
jgi:hypothetical protein